MSIAPRLFARAFSNSETLFDWETKKSRVAEIDAQMVDANFWNNQERAQAVVEERKSLNSILLPLDVAVQGTGVVATPAVSGRRGLPEVTLDSWYLIKPVVACPGSQAPVRQDGSLEAAA